MWSSVVHKVYRNPKIFFCLITFNSELRSVGNNVYLASPRKSIDGTSELKQLPVRRLFTIVPYKEDLWKFSDKCNENWPKHGLLNIAPDVSHDISISIEYHRAMYSPFNFLRLNFAHESSVAGTGCYIQKDTFPPVMIALIQKFAEIFLR